MSELKVAVTVDERPSHGWRNTPPVDEQELGRAYRRIRARLAAVLPGATWTRAGNRIEGFADGVDVELPELARALREAAYVGLGEQLAAITPVLVHLRRGRRSDPVTWTVGSPTDIAENYELG